MPVFSQRSTQIEIMDDLQCHGEVVHQTLRELEFINQWLGGNAITLDGVRQLIQGHEHESISIVDLGCGSGDMLRVVADWGKKHHLSLILTGIDANPHIIDYARTHCKHYPEISFEVQNVFSPEFQTKKYDLILGTLFYHHFTNQNLIELFSHLKVMARIGFIVNDIHRHWIAFHSIRILTKIFSKSNMVKFDAPLSVLRAFSREELTDLCKQAGITKYQLRWKWAFRWQLLAQF